MAIAIIGLGKMGGAMAQRLLKGGHRIAGLDQLAELWRSLAAMRNDFSGHAMGTKSL